MKLIDNKANVCSAPSYEVLDEGLMTKRGFLQEEDPLKRLPEQYIRWENTAETLPKLISQILDKKAPNKEGNYFYARQLLQEMPKYEVNNLTTENERRRAILLLGIFAHTWVWLPYVSGMSDKPEQFIPKQISVPLFQLSEIFARPPVLTNSDLFDYNWQQKISSGEIDIHNIDILNGFVENDAEKYFYLTFLMMTLKGAPAIEAMVKIQKILEGISFINNLVLGELKTNLEVIVKSLEEVKKILAQVFSTINKEDWFNTVRWFSVGWNNKNMFPNGVIYEGVELYNNQGQSFFGPSGFQYPIFQCVDAFLDIRHEAYINQVNSRLYMPSNQVQIISYIENSPKVRTFLTEHRIGKKTFPVDANSNYESLIASYNNCIRQVKNIRSLHFGVAAKYLTKMMKDIEDKIILTTGGEQDEHEHLLKEIINHHNIQIS